MSEQLTVLRNTDLYAIEESTAYTLEDHTGASAIKIVDDTLDLNLNRSLLDSMYMTSNLGQDAPQAGMWADDLGGSLGFFLRGGASTPQPDQHVFLKCLFGTEDIQAADTVATGTLTTDQFSVTTAASHNAGNLIRVQTDTAVFSVAKVLSVASPLLNVWPPLLEDPANTDPIQAAYNYVLADTGHPTFSMYAFFEGSKRLAYAGCRPSSLNMTFEVGERIPMNWTFAGLTPYYDYTADGETPVYQTSPKPLITLGVDVAFTYADIVTGSPSTTETVLTAPNHETAVGDYLCVDVGSGVYEWQAITGVSGNAGANQTLDHAAFSSAATATETAYVKRVEGCAQTGAMLDLTVEHEVLPVNCITASYGKVASKYGKRTVTLNKNAYFRSWEEYYKRDNVVGAELMVIAGSTANNTFAMYSPNIINVEPSLSFDELMLNPTAMQAVRGTTTGNEAEIVFTYF